MKPPIRSPKSARIAKYCDLVLMAHWDALTMDQAQIMVGIHLQIHKLTLQIRYILG